ncbi:MAG: class I SAM-dependent methyltransferase [Candidatus Binatia bacterium]
MKRFFFYCNRVVDFFAGRLVFQSAYYRESELTRLLNLFAHVDLEQWRGMKIIEVGAGLGHIGDVFVRLGFDVTSSDGRPEYVELMRARGRKAMVLDLDATGIDEVGDFDVVLAFGVLYHLAKPERFLRSCGKTVQVLLVESCVCDAFEPTIKPIVEAKGWRGQDQAVNRIGCRPSPSWIEEKCREAGFTEIRDISNAIGNWGIGKFDWEPRGTGEWSRDGVNLRKLWVCQKIAMRSV